MTNSRLILADRVHTLAPVAAGPPPNALLLQDGRVLAVGTAEEIVRAPPPGYYPPPHYDYDHHYDDDWDGSDAAIGFVAGAVVGAVVTDAAHSDNTTYVTEVTTTQAPAAVATLPCAATTVTASGTTYYRCGSTYYVQAYAQGGVLYVPTAPPPGH